MYKLLHPVLQIVIYFLLISFCDSCNTIIYTIAPPDGKVYVSISISKDFSLGEKNLIIQTVDMWRTGTHNRVEWRIVYENEIESVQQIHGAETRKVKFVKITSKHPFIVEQDAKHDTVLGLCGGNSIVDFATVYIVHDRINTSSKFFTIAAHEFGHSLGVKHTADPDSIMNRTPSYVAIRLTTDDITAFNNRSSTDH